MKTKTKLGSLLLSSILLTALTSLSVHAETVRDCVLEGTVKKTATEQDKVYVAFHSSRATEEGARCRMRKSEKLHFKQPADSEINNAAPGSKVEYRYIEDSENGSTWELRKVSSS